MLIHREQGHTNCVGCNQALNMSKLPPVPPSTALQRYVQPVASLARVLTNEDGPPTLDLLVEVSAALASSAWIACLRVVVDSRGFG